MDAALTARIHAAITAARRARETGQCLAANGFQVEASTPAALAALITADIAQWREVVRTAQIVVK